MRSYRSTYPFGSGWYTVVISFSTFEKAQSNIMNLPTNCCSLSESTKLDIPCRRIQCSKYIFAPCDGVLFLLWVVCVSFQYVIVVTARCQSLLRFLRCCPNISVAMKSGDLAKWTIWSVCLLVLKFCSHSWAIVAALNNALKVTNHMRSTTLLSTCIVHTSFSRMACQPRIVFQVKQTCS